MDKEKLKLIREISRTLGHMGKEITPGDFDILWDMDIDELIHMHHELLRQTDDVRLKKLN